MQMNLPGVPKAKQGREVAPKWEWTEASVWNERMLAALERGVKGGKWFSLMESRMREVRPSGLEGGVTFYPSFLPLSFTLSLRDTIATRKSFENSDMISGGS